MFCSNCGKEIAENVHFCPECGFTIGSGETNVKDSEVKKEVVQREERRAGISVDNHFDTIQQLTEEMNKSKKKWKIAAKIWGILCVLMMNVVW